MNRKYDGPEKREVCDPVPAACPQAAEFRSIHQKLHDGNERMNKLDAAMKANTDLTQEIKDILLMAKGFFKMCGHIGSAAKFITAVVGAMTAIWAAWHLKGRS